MFMPNDKSKPSIPAEIISQQDNEYNCSTLKFLWGLTWNPKLEPRASFYTLNKSALYYDCYRDEYTLTIDATCSVNDLRNILLRFQDYCEEYPLQNDMNDEATIYITGQAPQQIREKLNNLHKAL